MDIIIILPYQPQDNMRIDTDEIHRPPSRGAEHGTPQLHETHSTNDGVRTTRPVRKGRRSHPRLGLQVVAKVYSDGYVI